MRIAREGVVLVLVLLFVAAVVALLLHPFVALPILLLALYSLWFFRDPERVTPDVPGALVSPADGRILRADSTRISVFLNLFDVHVCRSPVSGTVESVNHRPGRFLQAFKDEASEQNERVTIVLADGPRRVRFTLVAGLIARRIRCKVVVGQRLAAGERVGLIRFGSRVDLDVPPGAHPSVTVGGRVVAGVTVVARRSPQAPEGTPVGPPNGFPI